MSKSLGAKVRINFEKWVRKYMVFWLPRMWYEEGKCMEVLIRNE